MSRTSEEYQGGKRGIGQHRSSPGPAVNSGQRTKLDEGVYVGPGLSGGEEHSQDHGVPGSDPINAHRSIHGEANTDPHNLRHRK